MTSYDSTVDTLKHKKSVKSKYQKLNKILNERINMHDDSKLSKNEKYAFDLATPKLKESEYGSDEYNNSLKLLNTALKHHYENNSHHPEHYENPFGENGMDLLDICEMFCDWLSAVERTKDGDFNKSLKINQKRFGINDQIINIFRTTYERYFKDDK